MTSNDFKPQSLAAALAYGEELFTSVLAKAKEAPRLEQVQRAPGTWADAQAIVQQREEEKRKQLSLKKDTKSKTAKGAPLPDQQQQNVAPPGSIIGNVVEASAFWMFTEVC